MPEPRKPINVQCGDCQHVWAAVYLPMEAMKVARVMKGMGCPMCGAPTKRIFMATDATAPTVVNP